MICPKEWPIDRGTLGPRSLTHGDLIVIIVSQY